MAERLAERLAASVCGLKASALAPAIVERARLCLLDWLGVTLQGAQTRVGRMVAATLPDGRRTGQASLIGTGRRASLCDAALFNGTAGHVLDFDDVHVGMEGHPSAAVLPAAVALAECRHLPARELFAAFVAGTEVACRLGALMNPDHYTRGWHATGTLGIFGAAAAAGRLLRLSPTRMAQAFGIAGTQAAGIRQVFGTMAKSLNAGRAAANGLLAALLAARGFTGPLDVFEGPRGIFSLFGHRSGSRHGADGFGGRWAVEDIAFKRFASCYSTHAPMEAALAVRPDCPPDRVRTARLWVAPLSRDVAPIGQPTNGLEAKFSLPYCTAVALVRGRGGVEAFSARAVRDPLVRRVANRLEVRSRRSLGDFEAVLEVRLRTGKRIEAHTDVGNAPPGGWSGLLEEKFLEGVTPIVGDGNARHVLDRVRALEGGAGLGPVMALLHPARRARGQR
jgi:2-methylcitrate dehydratase PrpD